MIRSTVLNGQTGHRISSNTTETFIVVFDTSLPKDGTRTVRLTNMQYEDVIGGVASSENITVADKENSGTFPVTETFTN